MYLARRVSRNVPGKPSLCSAAQGELGAQDFAQIKLLRAGH